MESITLGDQRFAFIDGMYWHLATQDSLLLHNVPLGNGIAPTISFMVNQGGLKGAVTPYAAARGDSPKEELWEEVRKRVAPTSPTRIGAMFLIDSEASAAEINERWFRGENRHLLRARVVGGISKVAKVDANWLDGLEPTWRERAAKYWSGAISETPRPEIIVEGVVYFPDWEQPPFGSFPPPSSNV